ncbi:P2Y purinoceptor 14-like [Sphaeramia orbicularis]|uniref:P2Y purinoceptor 14-like n=1 Tax=Sphaeramia orbicularis TaxID=375764 RepID=UPI0011802D7B|nr:P2Y purinoceptor 14-like [Sphaeramia orbicularis]
MSLLKGGAVTPMSNQTTRSGNRTDEGCGQVNASANLVFMVVYCLLFLVGLLLNGFTLKVYFCSGQQMSSSVTVYLKNLAAADFLMSLCLPVRVSNYASVTVLVRRLWCNFGASAFYLNMYASILFMGYVAANRYLKIVHPLGTHVLQRVRSAYIISSLTWVFLLSMMSVYILLSLITQQPLPSVPVSVTCDVLHSPQVRLLYQIIHCCSALIFLCVLVSLVFFYHSTSHRLALALHRQPASSRSKKLLRSRRNMLVLVVVFCVCFVPYHLVRLPYAFMYRRCSWSYAFFYLKELTTVVSVLNVCLDPLIYFIFCKAFRAQLSLRRVFSTTEGETNTVKTERRSSGVRGNSLTKQTVL